MLEIGIRVFHDFSNVGTISYEDITGNNYLDLFYNYDSYIIEKTNNNSFKNFYGIGLFYSDCPSMKFDHRYFNKYINILFNSDMLEFVRLKKENCKLQKDICENENLLSRVENNIINTEKKIEDGKIVLDDMVKKGLDNSRNELNCINENIDRNKGYLEDNNIRIKKIMSIYM